MAEIDLNRLAKIERINVVGTSGSGKSTVGRCLAELLKLPFYEIDSLFWKPNWEPSTDEEFFSKIQEIAEQPRWVLDGNYHRTEPIKWRQVQLVVWLDLPYIRTVLRVLVRCLKRAWANEEIWPNTGNRESLRQAFLSHDSIILWAMTSYSENRRRYTEIMQSPEYKHIWFIRLTSQAEVDALLGEVEKAAEHSLAAS